MHEFKTVRPPKEPNPLNQLLPLAFLLLIVALAFWLAEWQVVTAFLVAVLALPFLLIMGIHLSEMYFNDASLDLEGVFGISLVLSLVGLPIYLIGLLPLYYLLQYTPAPLTVSFPIAVTGLMLILLAFLMERDWSWSAAGVVVACSLVHAWVILYLAEKLKSP
ncbi:hypothetical protein [Wenzhouxiangella sp. AB-CW3]|uniref:hypothetical protein n=1 Tax=Wenzhouxiangella sp. AB-CW3 TaxID=2771012 RepID=UPI001CC303AA|nr:hypothetical protein [Wenzhouxiangella sp. AB-CW3]